ncbi:unnamed protein product, partial [Polarella glacialis]
MEAANGDAGKGQNVLVIRGWGQDKPGIADTFMKVVAGADCKVLDMAQFLLGSSLMFTFVLQMPDESSIGLMKSLTSCSEDLGLQLSFHFPDGSQVDGDEGKDNEAVIVIVSPVAITPALLADLDA